MTDGRKQAAVTIIQGMIVRGIVQIKSVFFQIIQYFRLGHRPCAARKGSGNAFLVMGRDLQIAETNIVLRKDLPDLFKSIVSVFRQSPCHERIAGRNDCRL